jgi:hypothetical protein
VITPTRTPSVSVPDRQVILLGGFADSAAGGTTRPSGNMFLLVKPTIIVSRELEGRLE